VIVLLQFMMDLKTDQEVVMRISGHGDGVPFLSVGSRWSLGGECAEDGLSSGFSVGWCCEESSLGGRVAEPCVTPYILLYCTLLTP
jgi:hypothetical protein